MFDAGSIEAKLTLDPSQFDKDMTAAEARVKRFEDAGHKVKISAVFDDSSMSKARQAFAQLDNDISKDAMSRLRSSPQGSVLGALNALFSPHPVTGAPSPQQAAQQGLLGKIIQSPGGGGTTGPVGGNSQGSVVQDVLGSSGGPAESNANRVSTMGLPPQDETTTDKVNVVGAPSDNDITTTDRVNTVGLPTSNDIETEDRVNVTGLPASGGTVTTEDKIKPDLDETGLKAKAEEAGKDVADEASDSAGEEARRKGSGWFSGMLSGIDGMIRSAVGTAIDDVEKSTGAGKGGGSLTSNILGGIGPSILGIGLNKTTGIAGAVVAGLAALPALGGVIGAGIGTALIGGMVAGVVATSPKLKAQFSAIGKDAEGVLTQAGAVIVPALSAVLNQVPALLKSVEPELAGVFKAVAPQLQGVFNGLVPIVKGLVSLIQAAAPAFGPFIGAIENLVSSLFPGLVAVTKAVVPIMGQFGTIMGQLGSNLGALFGDLAPAVQAGMTVLGALLGLIGGLLPVVAKLADVFADALAPVIVQFAGTVKALSPSLTAIGQIIADLATAMIGDLASAFGALAQLLTGIAPGLNAFAKALGQVFTVLENTGTFAILGNAIEDLAAPLAKLINALLEGLVPVLPPIVNFIGQLSTLLATTLANAVLTLIPPLTTLVTGVIQVLNALLPVLLPLLLSFAGVFTSALVSAVAGVAGALAAVISAIPPDVLGAIAVGVAAVAGGMKLWAAAMALIEGSAFAGAVVGIVDVVTAFTEATAGLSAAETALAGASLALDAVSPFAWAAGAAVALGALTAALVLTKVNSTTVVGEFQQQQAQLGYNIAGYQKLADTMTSTAAGFEKFGQANTDAVRGGGAAMQDLAGQVAAGAGQVSQAAVNMQSRLTTLSGKFGVSQTVIEQWASAAGINAVKFSGAGENVDTLTTAIVNFVNKNPQAVLAASSIGTQIAIFGDDAFNATTQLDAFNSIWQTLVGNLLTKQMAVTNSDTAFDGLAQTIKNSGADSDTAKQSFQQYIAQIGSSASALEKAGASVATINSYLQGQIDHIETLGPLNKSEQADLAALKAAQDAYANSTNGLNAQQLTLIGQFEQHLIPDLASMHANTPLVNTDISNLANSIIQTGNNSASTATDRANLIKDLEAMHVNAQTATTWVDNLQTKIDGLKGKVVQVGVTATAQGTLNAIAHLPGVATSTSSSLVFAAGGMMVSGGTPGKDSVLAMLMPGEVVVPTAMVQGGAVDHLRGSIPGFAAGGMVNLDQPGQWTASQEGSWAQQTAQSWASMAASAFQAAANAAVAQMDALKLSGSAASIQAMMQAAAAARGWTGAEWAALNAVELREAGYNPNAVNPTSGAYGLAQFIGGQSEYYQYGGNPTSAAGQITGMLAYISQRYGDPIAAEAHEVEYGWYDRGGALNPGYTLAYNGTGRPEQVVAGGGKTMGDLAARLDQLHADMRDMVSATRQVPAATGQHVGAAIGGAASAASFRSRYPRSSP